MQCSVMQWRVHVSRSCANCLHMYTHNCQSPYAWLPEFLLLLRHGIASFGWQLPHLRSSFDLAPACCDGVAVDRELAYGMSAS